MIDIDITVTRSDLLTAYVEGIQKAPDFTNTVVNDTVNRVAESVLKAFRTEPGAVVYPIQWKSAKQRKAFFASNGFGGGIPYRRQPEGSRLVDRWRLAVVYDSNALTSIHLINDSDKRRFVTGLDQQPFHHNTGWYQDANLVQQAGISLTDAIETDAIKILYAIEDYAESKG